MTTHSTYTTSSRPGVDASRSLEHHLRETGPHILAGLGVSGGILLLANRNIPSIAIPVLSSAADRVAYALRWTGLEGLTSVSAIFCIIGTKMKYAAYEPTDTKNEHVDATQKILSSTVEQFLTFTAAKLALASTLESTNMRLIPALSALFILGRFSFHAAFNHPARQFGETIGQVALFTTYGLFIYKLVQNGIHANLLTFSLR